MNSRHLVHLPVACITLCITLVVVHVNLRPRRRMITLVAGASVRRRARLVSHLPRHRRVVINGRIVVHVRHAGRHHRRH